MPDTTILLKKPTDILRRDHVWVKDLFDQYEKLDPGETARKRELFLEIREEISTHSRIEETLFYPALQNVDADRVQEALDDHRGFRNSLQELTEMGAGADFFDAKMKDLRERVDRHAGREETEIFPLALRLPKKALLELSAQIADLREGFRDHSTREDREEEVPFYPTLGTSDDARPPSPPPSESDPREKESRRYENWGSE